MPPPLIPDNPSLVLATVSADHSMELFAQCKRLMVDLLPLSVRPSFGAFNIRGYQLRHYQENIWTGAEQNFHIDRRGEEV